MNNKQNKPQKPNPEGDKSKHIGTAIIISLVTLLGLVSSLLALVGLLTLVSLLALVLAPFDNVRLKDIQPHFA